ncbi:MAG: methyltransferase domain-containing protein [Deltaproteobacteria bacterium]|nr:MAG: methyltransferase domain-containing protein [Deltaproteobacteria bacterium]
MSLHRPTPLPLTAPVIDRAASDAHLAEQLVAGHTVLLHGNYGRGIAIERAVRRLLPAPEETASFDERRAHRDQVTEVLDRLHTPIRDHLIAMGRAPECGFLAELYPERADFALPWLAVIDLVRAWRFYEEGVHLAALGHAVHPFYGTYAPARTEHIELFATWLSRYDGDKQRAIDVGTGTGVLARLLTRAGFAEVLATDLNPNAVESVRRDLKRRPAPIRVFEGDLLAPVDGRAELIVFNPPWTPGEVRTPLDMALVYEDGLFERFFAQAAEHLAPGGRVVLVFSNVMRLLRDDAPHPIDAELAGDRFELVDKLQRRIKPSGGRRTKERVEVWELRRL